MDYTRKTIAKSQAILEMSLLKYEGTVKWHEEHVLQQEQLQQQVVVRIMNVEEARIWAALGFPINENDLHHRVKETRQQIL